MANVFYADTQGIKSKADQMKLLCDDYEAVVKGLVNHAANLNDVWQGFSQKRFVNVYSDLFPRFLKFSENVEEYLKLLTSFSAKLESKDSEIASRIKNLF